MESLNNIIVFELRQCHIVDDWKEGQFATDYADYLIVVGG